MKFLRIFAAFTVLFTSVVVLTAQQPGQAELRIEPADRTLTVSAEDEVSVEPEVAILHIGFETQLGDAQAVYADGSHTSNAIIAALKQAGVAENAIHSESQRMERDYQKPHKFKLVQQWTVKSSPERAAEVLDVAITAGATSSGDIEWTVKDERALEAQALDRAAGRAKENAGVLAKAMGVHLGAVIYISNQVSVVRPIRMAAFAKEATTPQPLAIEPNKVTRSANVYAVYSIE